VRIGGTSMAAPVVAGAAALLLQAHPELNPDEVKALLTANTHVSAGQVPVGLGTSDGFALLAGSTITNTGPSTLNGHVGLHPGTAVTGTAPETINGSLHAADAIAQRAKIDLIKAYDNAAGRATPATVPADIGGLTLVPGAYRAASSLALTGTVTLDGQGDPSSVSSSRPARR
jgi:subtilisin family serine protease